MDRQLILILGNQLFDPRIFATLNVNSSRSIFFMREDRELASYYRFHKHKIVFFLAAMREYRRELEDAGYVVHYEALGSDVRTYDQSLKDFVADNQIRNVSCFEIEDKFFEKRVFECFKSQNISLEIWASPMFLTSRVLFQKYLAGHKKPFMKTFYEMQRKRLNILMNADRPIGGQWSFDTENRKSLPKTVYPPRAPSRVTKYCCGGGSISSDERICRSSR